MSAIRLSMVTNIPAPYRVPVLNRLAASADIDLTVLYAARTEPDRSWDLPALEHSHEFLRESTYRNRQGRFVHNNPDVVARLRRFSPDVVVTNGFNPTHLYGFAYSQMFRRKHVAMTDGTLVSESGISAMHRLARRIVYSRSAAFVGASQAARALLIARGAPECKIYLSPLCANSCIPWRWIDPALRQYDFLFSGRLVGIKNPLFALDVTLGVAKSLGRRVSLVVLGSGPMEREIEARSLELRDHVDTTLAGHVSQLDLPSWFGAARLFLFPTSWDPWGVVANEACMAGVPTVVSPDAGVAGELIVDGQNGYVRALEVSLWVAACVDLLQNPGRHTAFAREALRRVQPYNCENAARGIASAARRAFHGE